VRSLFVDGFQEVVEWGGGHWNLASRWLAAGTNGFERQDSGDRNFVLIVGGTGVVLTGGQCCRGVVATR